jgi:hypothetical protein
MKANSTRKAATRAAILPGVNIIEPEQFEQLDKIAGLPPEDVAEINRDKAFAATPVTMALKDVCDLIGWEVNPRSFASDALERLAAQLDAMTPEEGDAPDYETWRCFMALRSRMLLAARVERALRAGGDAGAPREVNPT